MAQSERERRVRRRDQLGLLVKIMSDPLGREYFYDLLASCHVYSTSFGTNALMMAFREGERNVGLRVAADVNEASPDLYLQMLKEAEHVRSQNSRAPRGDDAERASGNGADGSLADDSDASL